MRARPDARPRAQAPFHPNPQGSRGVGGSQVRGWSSERHTCCPRRGTDLGRADRNRVRCAVSKVWRPPRMANGTLGAARQLVQKNALLLGEGRDPAGRRDAEEPLDLAPVQRMKLGQMDSVPAVPLLSLTDQGRRVMGIGKLHDARASLASAPTSQDHHDDPDERTHHDCDESRCQHDSYDGSRVRPIQPLLNLTTCPPQRQDGPRP